MMDAREVASFIPVEAVCCGGPWILDRVDVDGTSSARPIGASGGLVGAFEVIAFEICFKVPSRSVASARDRGGLGGGGLLV